MPFLTNKIKDMKISKRLKLSFISIALITVVVGTAGLLGMMRFDRVHVGFANTHEFFACDCGYPY